MSPVPSAMSPVADDGAAPSGRRLALAPTPTLCRSSAGVCMLHEPGHELSCCSARQLARSTWGWQRGVVQSVAGGRVSVLCPGVPGLTDAGVVRLWHHRSLENVVGPGADVKVHERHGGLWLGSGGFGGAPRGDWLSVAVEQGLGSPPDPVDLEVWASGASAIVLTLP